jgi:hypothetical protein
MTVVTGGIGPYRPSARETYAAATGSFSQCAGSLKIAEKLHTRSRVVPEDSDFNVAITTHAASRTV